MPLSKSDLVRTALFSKCANLVESCYYPLLYHKYDGVSKRENLRYADCGKRAVLDVYRQEKGSPEKLPLFFYIHGGGWVSGKRSVRKYYCMRWATEGFVAVNAGYDYSPGTAYPEYLKQVFAALEYVLDRADEYGFDKRKVVVAGESAGAYLAAMLSAVATHRELYGKLGIEFKYRDFFVPSATLLLSGIYDPFRSLSTRAPFIGLYISAFAGEKRKKLKERFDNAFRETSVPELYADASFPPAFVVGSSRDKLEPESASFYNRLCANGARCEYFLCTGINGMHAASLDCVYGKSGRECYSRAAAFVKSALVL